MTVQEFNYKYRHHLEDGHYGLAISSPTVIDYLDKEFESEIEWCRANGLHFEFSQIKSKFGMTRVYSNSHKDSEWEKRIDKILNDER